MNQNDDYFTKLFELHDKENDLKEKIAKETENPLLSSQPIRTASGANVKY